MARTKSKKTQATLMSRLKLVNEILGVFMLSGALFMFIALISYHPQDQSFNTATGSQEIQNYAGKTGAYLADLMYQCAGYASLYLPFFLVALGLRRFRKSRAEHRFLKIICTGLIFAETAVLLQLRWTKADLFNRGVPISTGGTIGEILKVFFLNNFNELGSYILVISLLIITILLLTGISIQFVVQWGSHQLRRMWDHLTTILSARLQAYRQHRLKLKEMARAETERIIIRRKERVIDEAEPDEEYETSEQLELDRPLPQSKGKRTKKDKQYVQEEFTFVRDIEDYVMPSLNLLDDSPPPQEGILKRELTANSQILLDKLAKFEVQGRIAQVFPGPVITRYEFEPDPGIKLSRIIGLADDLGLAIKSKVAPIVAPVPGKSVVGIEIPNQKRDIIMLKDIINSDAYNRMSSTIKLALGKDTSGNPYATGLEAMPHLLVAGATGSGKSVCIHSIIASLLYSAPPILLNMIMIDPKMLELSVYNKIPHLREPVVTSAKKAAKALKWAVSEMEDRYKILAQLGVRSIELYNAKLKEMIEKSEEIPEGYPNPMPYLVIIIDELADLMMVAAADVENYIARLAQMARAAGIHLVISTQRPSVNVLTGIIKANFPSRIAFQVSSKVDSRTILDMNGAEKLLGKGDMLFKPPNGRCVRLHGAFVSEIEVQRLVQYVSQFKIMKKEESIFKIVDKKEDDGQKHEVDDDLFDQAVQIIVQSGNASISMLQRRLRIGHSRAARLIDLMEREGVVGPFEGSKSREVLWKPEDLPMLEEDHYDQD
ncbi:DNA translocase FtsK 4TM domain-containing protein [bacterium]|nr:DNA translocase FtsK 4TM domain-containing protein [bacterium]